MDCGARSSRAYGLHQQGQLDAPAEIYADMRALDSRNFAALQLLGVLRGQQGRNPEAKKLLQAALDIQSAQFGRPGQFRPGTHGNTSVPGGAGGKAIPAFETNLLKEAAQLGVAPLTGSFSHPICPRPGTWRPAVRIDGELYWDGGVLSNTPVEAVFDDKPRRDGLVFAVHVWNPNGPEPDSILKVMNRQKDLQYSSRAGALIARQRQIHRLRHIISELTARLPEEALRENLVREMASYGCPTRMHVVRLLAPQVRGEDHAKDIDFSANGIKTRWQAGYADANRVLKAQPWAKPVDPIEGFILHEAKADEMQDQPTP